MIDPNMSNKNESKKLQKKQWRYAVSIKKQIKALRRNPDTQLAAELLPVYLDFVAPTLNENPNERAEYYILLSEMINNANIEHQI